MRKAVSVESLELCSYGCGEKAQFRNYSGKMMCASSANSCPANKRKNSEKAKLAYSEDRRVPQIEQYKNISQASKDKMSWNKGKVTASFEINGKGNHKDYLILERGHRCETCNLEYWQDLPITLELDHISGDRKDNRKDNLRLLCPNCHSQTPTWKRGKLTGWRRKKYSDEEFVSAIKNSQNLNQVLESLDLRYGSAGTVVDIMSKYQVGFKGM